MIWGLGLLRERQRRDVCLLVRVSTVIKTPVHAAVSFPPLNSRGLGLENATPDHLASFAFGPPEGWQRFSLYFLSARGAVFRICPVVPFGTTLSAAALDELEKTSDGPHTDAWLQRALQRQAGPRSAEHAAHAVRVALRDHVPALCGPLEVMGPGDEELEPHLTAIWERQDGNDVAEQLLIRRSGLALVWRGRGPAG